MPCSVLLNPIIIVIIITCLCKQNWSLFKNHQENVATVVLHQKLKMLGIMISIVHWEGAKPEVEHSDKLDSFEDESTL